MIIKNNKITYHLFNLSDTIVAGVIYSETDSSVEALMEFFDKNILTDYVLITNAALNRNPSADLISKFKTYLKGKDSKFKYLHESYLIYSTLIKTFCSRNDCAANLVSLINLDKK